MMGAHPRRSAADVCRIAGVVALLCASGCRAADEPLFVVGHEARGANVEASAPAHDIPPASAAAALSDCLSAGAPSDESDPEAVEADLATLYGTEAPTPQWLDAAGRPDDHAGAALTLLARADEEGLDADSYAHAALSRQAETLRHRAEPTLRERACFDVALSRSVLTYVRHLHLGRVDPRTMGFNLVIPPEPHDFATLVREARAADRIASLRDELVPQLPQYDAVRMALVRYRALAMGPATSDIPAPVPGSSRATHGRAQKRSACT